jgi:hypothetical protein
MEYVAFDVSALLSDLSYMTPSVASFVVVSALLLLSDFAEEAAP